MREKHHDDQMTSASMEDEEDHELKNYAPSGTGTVGTVKVECDFFELNEDEFNQIKNSAMPEFASFTLDGKECYHCGEEFSSTTAMHQHPSICTRMKNATNLGKVMKIDGTVEEINGVKIHPVPSRPLPNKSRPSTSGSTKARRVPVEKMYMKRESSADMHHRQKPVDLSCRVLQPDSSDNLVIAQEDDDIEGNVDVMHDTGSPDDRIVEMEQPNNDQRYESNLENNQPIDEGHDHVQHYDNRVHDNGYNNHSRSHNGVKCNLCGQMLRDRMTLRIHKLQCTKNYQLPVRKSGHSGSVVLSGRSTVKGHCCYHCDRMFPSKDELRNHVAEISKMNLAEY